MSRPKKIKTEDLPVETGKIEILYCYEGIVAVSLNGTNGYTITPNNLIDLIKKKGYSKGVECTFIVSPTNRLVPKW